MSYFDYGSLNPRTLYTHLHGYQTKVYTPENGLNPKELKAATDAALKLKLYRLDVGIILKEVPLAENSDWPGYQDFVRLEQWFMSAIEPEEGFPMDEEEPEQNDLDIEDETVKKSVIRTVEQIIDDYPELINKPKEVMEKVNEKLQSCDYSDLSYELVNDILADYRKKLEDGNR